MDYTSKILSEIINHESTVEEIVVETWILEELEKEQNVFYEMQGMENKCSLNELREVLGAPIKIASELDYLPNGYRFNFEDV